MLTKLRLSWGMHFLHRKTCRLFILIISFGVSNAFAGLTSGFSFLSTDFSPRSAAMGSAFITMRGDLNTLNLNPAGLVSVKGKPFLFNYTNYLLDINGGQAAYSFIAPYLQRVAVAVSYMDYGDFKATDQYATPTGESFSAHDFALTLTQAGNLDRYFSYGVSAKYAFSQIENYTAQALAFDFGLQYAAPFENDLFFAVTLLNTGWNVKRYSNVKESLPTMLNVGVSKKLAHLPLEVSVMLRGLNQDSGEWYDRLKRFSAGGELTLSKHLRLRLGYNHSLHQDLETSATAQGNFGGVSGGMAIYWKSFRFDYAYSNLQDLGSVHRFGISGYIH
jgi:hypothetical protein